MSREMRNVTFTGAWTKYNANESASFPKEKAKKLVDDGFAVYTTSLNRKALVKDPDPEPEVQPEEDLTAAPEDEDQGDAPEEVDEDEDSIPGPGNALLPKHKGGGYYNLVDEDTGEYVRGPFKKTVLEEIGYFQ